MQIFCLDVPLSGVHSWFCYC